MNLWNSALDCSIPARGAGGVALAEPRCESLGSGSIHLSASSSVSLHYSSNLEKVAMDAQGAFFLFSRFAPAGSLCLRQSVESGEAIQTWVYRGDTIYLTEDQCVSQPSSERLLFTVDGDQHRDLSLAKVDETTVCSALTGTSTGHLPIKAQGLLQKWAWRAGGGEWLQGTASSWRCRVALHMTSRQIYMPAYRGPM